MDVAHKVGAGLIVEYMEARVTPEAAQRSRLRAKQKRTDDMLNACHWGDTAMVQRLLDKGVSPDVADYDGKTALFVATVNGKEVGLGLGGWPDLDTGVGGAGRFFKVWLDDVVDTTLL